MWCLPCGQTVPRLSRYAKVLWLCRDLFGGRGLGKFRWAKPPQPIRRFLQEAFLSDLHVIIWLSRWRWRQRGSKSWQVLDDLALEILTEVGSGLIWVEIATRRGGFTRRQIAHSTGLLSSKKSQSPRIKRSRNAPNTSRILVMNWLPAAEVSVGLPVRMSWLPGPGRRIWHRKLWSNTLSWVSECLAASCWWGASRESGALKSLRHAQCQVKEKETSTPTQWKFRVFLVKCFNSSTCASMCWHLHSSHLASSQHVNETELYIYFNFQRFWGQTLNAFEEFWSPRIQTKWRTHRACLSSRKRQQEFKMITSLSPQE